MLETESLYYNTILYKVPLGMAALSARKLELDRTSQADDPELTEALYMALADEFSEINYETVAENCRKRARYWADLKKVKRG